VIVECWPKNSNCEIVREGAIYGVPEELKA
jgi:hypothetical protein